MNVQNDMSNQALSTPLDVEDLDRSAETVAYITDLMVELQTIANVSGLRSLSRDIDCVIKKHVV